MIEEIIMDEIYDEGDVEGLSLSLSRTHTHTLSLSLSLSLSIYLSISLSLSLVPHCVSKYVFMLTLLWQRVEKNHAVLKKQGSAFAVKPVSFVGHNTRVPEQVF